MESDSLVTALHVEAARLFLPLAADAKETDVHLVIKVTVRIANNASRPFALF